MSKIVAETDPSPFRYISAAGDASVLVICDHASPVIPARYGDLGLTPEERWSHVVWDIGAAAVASGLAARLGCPAMFSGVSRLVIDCNRHLGNPGSIPANSCGVAVPGNEGLDRAEADARAEAWFWPYHHAITSELARLGSSGVAPAVISVHSFTPALNGQSRPWHVGVLWNQDPRMAVPVMQWLAKRPGMVVGDNQPYSGRDVNYSVDTHAGAAGLPHISFEIRQDLLSDPLGVETWIDLLDAALSGVLADPVLYQAKIV